MFILRYYLPLRANQMFLKMLGTAAGHANANCRKSRGGTRQEWMEYKRAHVPTHTTVRGATQTVVADTVG